MAEKNATFVDRIRNRLNKFLTADQEAPSSELKPEDATTLSRMLAALRAAYGDVFNLKGTRLERYDQFKFLDHNLAEATAALNVYADNIVSGTVGGEETYYVTIDEDEPKIEELEQLIEDTEQRCGIKDQIWDISRDLTRDGDVFAEVVITQEDAEYFVEKLKVLPTKEIEADVDDYGSFKDPAFPYIQRPAAAPTKPIPFDWWRLIHFKVGSGVYGYDRSIFANASHRIGQQLMWLDESLVIARMSRAWQRFAYLIDTKNMSPDDAFAFIEKFLTRVKTRTLIDKTTGRTTLSDSPLMPDEDIAIPTGEGMKSDIKVLGGDTNVSNIADVQYLQNKFLMAVTVPKAYVSLEEGISAKATINQLDVQFARQVRRRQNSLVPGLKQFYRIVFYLAGMDPDSFQWDVAFPELATTDEMLKWELLQVKANIAKTLVVDVGVVNNNYIFKELLGMDDDEIQAYAAVLPPEAGEEQIALPPETAMLVRRDPMVRAALSDLKDIMAMKMSRAEALAGKVPVGVEREEPLKHKH